MFKSLYSLPAIFSPKLLFRLIRTFPWLPRIICLFPTQYGTQWVHMINMLDKIIVETLLQTSLPIAPSHPFWLNCKKWNSFFQNHEVGNYFFFIYFFIRWPSSTLALPPQQYGSMMIKIMKTMIFLPIIIIHIIINGIIIICLSSWNGAKRMISFGSIVFGYWFWSMVNDHWSG